jgi:GNAT superfamily N-acetyltransferase
MITIEQLQNADERIVADINELYGFLSESRDGRRATRTSLEDSLNNGFIFVARDDEKIIGMASLFLIRKPKGYSATVEDVVVNESYRGQGTGERLMRAVIECAKTNHVHSLHLTSRFSRTAAHHLYEKAGFQRKDSYVYRQILG